MIYTSLDRDKNVHYLNTHITQAQCDQMAKLVFQYLAIYNNENLPKIIQIVSKWLHNFAKYEMNLKNMAKDFSICCKRGKISPNLVTLLKRHIRHQ